MAFGFGVLGHGPDTLWSMSPRELKAAMRGRRGGGTVAPPSRRDFLALSACFPDSHLSE